MNGSHATPGAYPAPGGTPAGTGGDLDMDVLPTDGEGRTASFRIAFLNQSGAPVAVALQVHGFPAGLRYRITPAASAVVPAHAAAVPFTVRVAPKVPTLMGRPKRYAIELCGVPVGPAHADKPLVAWAHFTYVPRYAGLSRPRWLSALPRRTVVLLLGAFGVTPFSWRGEG